MEATNAERYKRAWAWDRLRGTWLSEFVRRNLHLGNDLRDLIGCPRVLLPEVEQLAQSLAVLDRQTPAISPAAMQAENPIFLLSTGWRTGSTLLQRILMTDSRLLLWGEPFGEMTIVPRIAAMMARLLSPANLMNWKSQPDPKSSVLPTSWIAILYPPAENLRFALRNLFDSWLGASARQYNFTRWGFKEVRLGALEATFLHWLYPAAKFVIISRHPFDAYRSLADAGWKQVYYRYPDVPIESATSFARHWNRLAVSWSHLPPAFPARHIRYEDLIGRKVDFRSLEAWLGIEIRENVALSVAVGATARKSPLGWLHRWLVTREAAPGLRALGYSG
jgi:Sulfotransferase family